MNEMPPSSTNLAEAAVNRGASVPAEGRPEKRQLSYTQLNMFLRCPRQYEYRYIHGLKVPPSGAMVQSRVWHQTVGNCLPGPGGLSRIFFEQGAGQTRGFRLT